MAAFSTLYAADGNAGKKWSPGKDAFKTPQSTLAELYKAVSFGPGNVPDWDKVKTSFFLPEAVIVLRTGREKMSVIDRDGFANLFIHDIKKYKLDKTGFQEKLLSQKMTIFGNIAHCFAVYEASVSGGVKQRGFDSFQFFKKDGRWWIVSIVNDVPTPGNPIPEKFLKSSGK